MRVLVTGANGFLGRAVSRSLEAGGRHEVLRLCRKGGGAPNEILADLTAESLPSRLPAQLDLIVHAGAYVPARESAAELELAMKTNAEATLRLLEYSVKAGVKRFVYVSSAAVYGAASAPAAVAETEEPRPDNHYALSKLAGELMLEAYRFVHGVETVGLRFSYIYGPGMRESSVVKKFAGLARANAVLPLFNSGDDYFDLVHVDDGVRAVESAMERGRGAYNIGSGKPTSVLELASTMIAVLGSTSRIEKMPSSGKYHSKYLDITRAATELNWRPGVSLREGLGGI